MVTDEGNVRCQQDIKECLEFGREVRVEMDVVAPGRGGVTEDTKSAGRLGTGAED